MVIPVVAPVTCPQSTNMGPIVSTLPLPPDSEALVVTPLPGMLPFAEIGGWV